ncbi:hypothetical protein AAVH_16169 [Aphelenchoides avenae]|nr:hypothetical protein AAVH_16169 [Aphelenchus avenae]
MVPCTALPTPTSPLDAEDLNNDDSNEKFERTGHVVKFAWSMNPPLSWTYTPSRDSAASFEGQPRSHEEAQANIHRDLLEAVRDAVKATGLPWEDITVSTTFRAAIVRNCLSSQPSEDSPDATKAGVFFGIVERSGSATASPTVTHKAQSVAAPISVGQCIDIVSGRFCTTNLVKYPFLKDAVIEVQGLDATSHQQRSNFAAYLTTILSYNYGARVIGWVHGA